MADPTGGAEGGTNARPLNDTLAQTGPGIPDDAAEPGYDPVADTQAEHDAPTPDPDKVFPGP